MRLKNKNIYVLPTENSSRISYGKDGVLELHRLQWRKNTQNIYITSDEEIKEGDLCLNEGDFDKHLIFKADSFFFNTGLEAKKIILTTDQDLIKDGAQSIDDEFLEWFVKNPSCERIEVNGISDVALGGFADVYYKIIIPRTTQQIINEDYAGGLEMGQIPAKEEAKQETLEEVAERYYEDEVSINAFVNGAKWQQENWDEMITAEICKEHINGFKEGVKYQQDNNKFSEEEVLVLLHKRDKHNIDNPNTFKGWKAPKEWFEQFKKK